MPAKEKVETKSKEKKPRVPTGLGGGLPRSTQDNKLTRQSSKPRITNDDKKVYSKPDILNKERRNSN